MAILTKRYIDENMIRTSRNDEVRMICPKYGCDDTWGHLYYNVYSGKFICHHCGYKGIKKARVKMVEFSSREFSGDMPKGVLPIKKCKGKVEKDVVKYLYDRGLNDHDIRRYNIHYGFKGIWHKRAIFPFIRKNKLVYYCGRSIKEDTKKKVINASGSRELFNIEIASEWQEIVLVEGIIDAIMTGSDAVAILGKSITRNQLEILKEYCIRAIYIMLDAEEDISKSYKIAKSVIPYVKKVFIIRLEKGDPGDLRLRELGKIKYWKNLPSEEYTVSNKLRRLELKI